jgi:putative tricarboxylic transport membrane protein
MRFNHDQLTSILGLIIGALILIHSLSYDLGSYSFPGPGLFPFLHGTVIIILCLVGLVDASLERLNGVLWTAVFKGKLWWRPCLSIAFLLFFASALEYLGFIITTTIFIALILKVLERRRWSIALMVALACSLASWALFKIGLMAQLPSGIWGF